MERVKMLKNKRLQRINELYINEDENHTTSNNNEIIQIKTDYVTKNLCKQNATQILNIRHLNNIISNKTVGDTDENDKITLRNYQKKK